MTLPTPKLDPTTAAPARASGSFVGADAPKAAASPSLTQAPDAPDAVEPADGYPLALRRHKSPVQANCIVLLRPEPTARFRAVGQALPRAVNVGLPLSLTPAQQYRAQRRLDAFASVPPQVAPTPRPSGPPRARPLVQYRPDSPPPPYESTASQQASQDRGRGLPRPN